MKRCKRCDLNFPDSSDYCELCGGALPHPTELRCPACLETVQPGWSFCPSCQAALRSSNTSDLVSKPTRATISLDSCASEITAPLREDRPVDYSKPATVSIVQIRIRCRSCKGVVEEDSTFCKFCGAIMTEDTFAPLARTEPLTITTNYDRTAPTLTMLESYGSSSDTPEPSSRLWRGLLVLSFLVVCVAGLGVAGWWWWSSRSSPLQTLSQANQNESSSTSTPNSQSQSDQNTAEGTPDNELKNLRQRRANANGTDGSQLISVIEAAEKKFPNDYRFSYERSKLSIKGIVSHDEAFYALSLAAEKAIDNGKAREMLDNLSIDKEGDFYKLARGHHEWEAIIEALSSEDKSILKEAFSRHSSRPHQ